MLAITTQIGTSLIDPSSFKTSSTSFPISSSLECLTNAWSPDNTQLYLASSSLIKRYTPSESLLEELYRGSDTVTCLAMKDKGGILFFAAANRVWSLDCTHSPGKVLASLEPHKKIIRRISISNDGTLLASVSTSAVFVHDLTQASHTQLKGLPDRKPVNCCVFHQHSRTRLLLGIGRDIVVYDSTRPGSPLKTVRMPGSGDIVGVAASPFSKSLVAAATTSGDVVLVDLDKDNGILKSVNVKTSLTCCAFTAEGAAIYLGTESGRLLILDLRSLEKGPKSFTIGDGNAPIEAINVQGKSKSRHGDSASVKVKSSSTAVVQSSPQRATSSKRPTSISAFVVGSGKSPARTTLSKIRVGVGITPRKKFHSPARTPLSETKNLGQTAVSGSPMLSRRVKPLRLQRSEEHVENRETQVRPPSPTSCEFTKVAEKKSARQRNKHTSSHKLGQDVERLGLGSAPESISGHLAAMRVRSGPSVNGPRNEGDRPKSVTRRTTSESIGDASTGRKLRATSIYVRQVSSKGVAHMQQDRRSTTPDSSDDHLGMSSPELPREPVTPISLGKNAASATCAGSGILELTKSKGKEKDKVMEVKKIRFADEEAAEMSDELEEEGDAEIVEEEREQELSLQVSPRRPTAPPAWLQSPHRSSAGNLHMNAAAQDFLRNIVHDVMHDLQRETKAEMMGLHLDLVRMGRGWKRELRDIMEEWRGEMEELKAENRRLKEENERLRRGY